MYHVQMKYSAPHSLKKNMYHIQLHVCGTFNDVRGTFNDVRGTFNDVRGTPKMYVGHSH